MKHPGHTSFLILAASVTLLVGALYLYMHYQVNISVSKATAAREVAQKEGAYKEKEKDVLKMYQATVAERAQLAGYFIPADKTVDFIEAVESIGPISGGSLLLSSIEADPLDVTKPGTQGKVHAHVEAHGSWVSIMKMLMFAERLPYKVTINNIHIAYEGTGDTKNASREWRLSFNIEANIIVTLVKKPS